jgi:phosphate-selective porin OprO and OprP
MTFSIKVGSSIRTAGLAAAAWIWGVGIPCYADDPDQPAATEAAAGESAVDPISPSLDERLRQLQQEVDELQGEMQAQQVTDTGQNAAATTADTSGFTIRSRDGNFVLHIGADLQVDNRSYLGPGSASDTDTIVLRRVRPTLYGTVYKYVDFYFRPDFGLGTTAIYDAYIQLNFVPWAWIRAGKFKPPVGLERLQEDDNTNFVERALPTVLVPQRDIGFQIGAALFHGRVSYQLGVFNGVPDSSIGTDTAASNHRDYAARLFLAPFAPNTGESALAGLGFGFAATGGNTDGESLPTFKTFGQEPFFTFNSGVTAAGHRTRLAPQAYYYVGAFGLLSEYGANEEGFQKGALRREISFRAYNVELTYILTGERKSFTNPTPKHSLDPLHRNGGGWGAWEVAIRVDDFEAENGVYTYGLVNPAISPRRSHEWTGGVNWYLNRLVRITGDYGVTAFGGGAANGGNKAPEKVFILRFQINFT